MPAPQTGEPLPLAEVCFAVAIVPMAPIKDEIAQASAAIGQRFENKNIIDNSLFPAHLSVYLGGTDREFLDVLGKELHIATERFVDERILAKQVHGDNRGLVSVHCTETNQLIDLLHTVCHTCAKLHQEFPRYRPRAIESWETLPAAKKELIVKYGTDKLPPFWQPHLSVADVPPQDVIEACKIARSIIYLPQKFGIEAMELVDIGPRNERWRVLKRWRRGSADSLSSESTKNRGG